MDKIKQRQYFRKYQSKNKDKLKKQKAEWYQKNKKRISKHQKEYRKGKKLVCSICKRKLIS